MALRFFACAAAPDARWPEHFEQELSAADWHTCAEWAGVEDETEARRLLQPLKAARPTRAGEALQLDFGAPGLVRVEPLSVEELQTLREENPGPPGELSWGLRLSLEGSSGVSGDVIAELLQAIAIGLAGEQGWVLTPSGKWWDSARRCWA